MQEIWKDIKDYEGVYKVSNFGRIKVLSKKLKNDKTTEEIIKKPSKIPKGYLRIGLYKNGKPKYFYVHRLVAEAFLENNNNYPCVNHKDLNPTNNHLENLEWISYKDNNSYKNHKLRRSISKIIFYIKRDYPKEKEIIELAEELKNKIKEL